MVVRPALMYGLARVALTRRQEAELKVVELMTSGHLCAPTQAHILEQRLVAGRRQEVESLHNVLFH